MNITRNNAVLFGINIQVTRNLVKKDKAATQYFRKHGGKQGQDVNQKILQTIDGKDWPIQKEIRQLVYKFEKEVKRLTLDATIRGSNVSTVHNAEELRNCIEITNHELRDLIDKFIEQLPEMKRVDKLRFGDFYNPTLYPTEYKIRKWKIASFMTKLDVEFYSENESILQDAEKEKCNRLIEAFGKSVDTLSKFLDGKTGSVKEATLNNVIKEIQALSQFDFGHKDQPIFDGILERIKSLAVSTDLNRFREVVKSGDVEEAEKEKASLETELERLERECEGIF